MGGATWHGGGPWCWGPEAGVELTVGHRFQGPGAGPPPFCCPTSLGSGPSREEEGQAGAWPRFLGQRKGWWGGAGDF